MRRVAAVVVDVVLLTVLGYGAFKLALHFAACGSNMGKCPALTPVAMILILLAAVVYLGVPQLVWGKTLGEHLSRAGVTGTSVND